MAAVLGVGMAAVLGVGVAAVLGVGVAAVLDRVGEICVGFEVKRC